MPSIGIYSYELYNFFGVENIIRIGSMGALADSVRVRDIVFGEAASTDSAYLSQFELPGIFLQAIRLMDLDPLFQRCFQPCFFLRPVHLRSRVRPFRRR